MQEINPPPPKKPQNPENHRAAKIYQLPVQMNTIFKYIEELMQSLLQVYIWYMYMINLVKLYQYLVLGAQPPLILVLICKYLLVIELSILICT